MKREKFEIAQVIEQFYIDFAVKHNPNRWILQNLNDLRACRTSALGGHKEEKCDSCGHTRISYNSCRNRHCPKCQSSKQAFWVEDTSQRIIDTKYFHIIFTVPEVLNEISLLNSKLFYNTLFKAVWGTLQTFGYTEYGVETGAVALLHTWGQNLSLHPHIHCLVPAGGIDLSGNFKEIGKKGKYLYPVKKLSAVFKGKMMQLIKKQLIEKKQLHRYQKTVDKAYSKKWVVFSQAGFGTAEHVIKYLGQYINRVAISNHRIKNIDDKNVSFFIKDYKDKGKRKLIKLAGVEFLRRFSMHILPKRFVKIRSYGILSNRNKKKTVLLRKAVDRPENETVPERIKRLTDYDITLCPVCQKGRMHIVKESEKPRIRSPEKAAQLKLKL